MDLPIASVHFEGKSRLRQDYGDIPGLMSDILAEGQLQDILVRPDNDLPDAYVLIDGGRRFLAFKAIYKKGLKVPGTEPGCIGAKVREPETELRSMVLEYKSNSIRADFNWRETALFIKKLHYSMVELEPEIWKVRSTAQAIGKSKESVYKYLALVADPEIFDHPRVKSADSFVAAYRQFEILKDKARRKAEAELLEKQVNEARKLSDEKGVPLETKGILADPKALAERAWKSANLGDARTWLRRQQDESFSWFHWDPPYGGEQSGGANPTYEEFDDTESNAWTLIEETLPEIHRVLRDGSWFAIWYIPQFYHRLLGLLRGHKFSNGTCTFCGCGWDDIHLRKHCPESDTWFWCNPYPFTWYKSNRMADAHEIRRYCVNAQEHFLLACKSSNPILPASNVQNVLSHPMPTQKQRKHVTHKPKELLADILDIISVPGSRGGDCGTGSGSIFEAAFGTGRDCLGTDISETYYHTSLEAAKRGLANWGELR